jgi:hypothetical protein
MAIIRFTDVQARPIEFLDFTSGSCWIPGSCTPCTGLNHLILNGFFQRCRIGHDPRVEPVKTTSYAKLDQLDPGIQYEPHEFDP